MVRRAARFLEEGAEANRILILTFTRTSADDLKRKITQLETTEASNIDAGTVHSLALRILQEERALAATGRVARPLMEFEERCMLLDMPGNMIDKRERLAAFCTAWARLDHESPSGWPTDPADRQFHHDLEDWLRFHRAMLLDELVPLALAYLRQEPTSAYRARYSHVLVDEYQDLNRAEQVLIDVLAGNTAEFTAIGDDDQSIYTTFRNAHPEGIVNFPYRHEGTDARTLTRSLRCPPNIVAMANAFLTHPDTDRLTDRLIDADESRGNAEVTIIRWATLDREVAGLARFIRWYCDSKGCSPGDVIVLSPRRQIGYRIRDALRAGGTDATSFFHEEALESDEAKLKFTLLRLFTDTEDRVGLRYWLGSPTPRPAAYRRLHEHCEQSGDSPWVAMSAVLSGGLTFTDSAVLRERFESLTAQMDGLTGLLGHEFVEAWLGAPGNDPNGKLTDIRGMAVRICDAEPMVTPTELRSKLIDEIVQPEIPTELDCVRVMSLHKSKGLTAKLTVITGFAAGMIPFVKNNLTPSEQHRSMQEQRRLFFVAITRPTDTLVLSSAAQVRTGEALQMGLALPGTRYWRRTAPSPFATQLGEDAPEEALGGDAWLTDIGVP